MNFITPAYAQAAGAGGAAEMAMQFAPFAIILVIMYFLILRPQQKRQQAHLELVRNVRRGDTVTTSSGIVGKITKLGDADTITVEIAKGVEVTVMKSTVSGLVGAAKPVVADKKKTDKNDNAVVSRSSVANDN